MVLNPQNKPQSKTISLLNLILINTLTLIIVFKENWDLPTYIWFLFIQIIVDVLYSMFWLIINYYKANTEILKSEVEKYILIFFFVYPLLLFVFDSSRLINPKYTFDFAVYATPGNLYILSRLIDLGFTYIKTNPTNLLANSPLSIIIGRIVIFMTFGAFTAFPSIGWFGRDTGGVEILAFIIIMSTFYEIGFKYFPNVIFFGKRKQK